MHPSLLYRVCLGLLGLALAIDAYAIPEQPGMHRRGSSSRVKVVDDIIAGEFIVGLKKREFSAEQLHELRVRLSSEFGVVCDSTYVIGRFTALFIHAENESVANRLVSVPEVEFVEPNRVVRSSPDQCKEETTGRTLWGLSRTGRRDVIPNDISSDDLTYSSSKFNDGCGVYAYVFDTGIRTTHVEFKNGRASWGFTAPSLNEPDEDLDGHGTHVSGTIGGLTVGVAKNVYLIAVKVLDNQGSGTLGDLLLGIEWAVNDFRKKTDQNGTLARAVGNLSLGFSGVSDAANAALAEAVDAGINMAVAAGNDNVDACTRSPYAANATTVAASNYTDTLATFSNWGSCVDIVGPGVDIYSAYYLSDTDYHVLSGTSQATPHITGAMARYLSTQEETPTPAEVKAWLLATATAGQLSIPTGGASSTPNLLVYMNCTSMVGDIKCTSHAN